MNHDGPRVPHPHLARRCTALAAALLCTFIWLMIYSALWHAQIVRGWIHHAILLACGAVAFVAPCLAVWLLAQGYDHMRHLRRS